MKSNQVTTRQEPSLLRILVCFTFLAICAQLSLFIIHHEVSGLLNSLMNSSLSRDMYYPVILLPIITFIVFQLIAYAIFIVWIWFIAISVGELFQLSKAFTFWFGILCWFIAVFAILSLNYYYFQGSFYTNLMSQIAWFKAIYLSCFFASLIFLVLTTVFGYINLFLYGRHLIIGSFLLLISICVAAFSVYDRLDLFSAQYFKKDTRTNIIIIGMDSLRPDFISYFGDSLTQTKNIDNFLGKATIFTNAYTPLARTFPAWMSVLTGKYPRHNGVRNNLEDPALVDGNDTLAKHLQRAGYETIYATDENRFSNIDSIYGFDHIIGPSMGYDDFLLGGLSDFPLRNLLMNLPISRYLFPYNYSNRANAITYEPDTFIQLIKSALANRTGKPLFIAMHLCITHWPFTWAQDGLDTNSDVSDQYRNSVKEVDAQLGRIMQLLKENGLLEHSLVVLLSDHGTSLGVPGDRFITKKNYLGDWQKTNMINLARKNPDLYANSSGKQDDSISISYGHGTDLLSLKQYNVLLSFKGYGINIPDQMINERSALIDISPTILDYLKLPPIAKADGTSMLKYLSEKPVQARQQVNQSTHVAVKEKELTRPIFLETGDTIDAIETNHIKIAKVLKERINAYKVNLTNGLIYLDPPPEKSLIKSKQRGILWSDWLFVWYTMPNNYLPALSEMRTKSYYHYFVLANVKTGQWTLSASSALGKKAPLSTLVQKLKEFYGDEAEGLDIKNILLD